jgi:hypothetical protein
VRRALPSGRRSLVALSAAGVCAALGLSGCGQSGQALAQQACVHVTLSVRYFERSTKAGLPAGEAAALRTKADAELRAAMPLAADATSADGGLNALMTTISEGATVDESHLVPALKVQCASVNTNVNVNPDPAGNLPGT